MYREVTERPNRGAYQATYSPETQRMEPVVALKTQGLIKKVRPARRCTKDVR